MKIHKMIAYLLAMLGLLILLPQISGADPLDNWHWRNPVPTGNYLGAVTYGNGIFVAVGEGGTILTSPDGVTWTPRASEVTSHPWPYDFSPFQVRSQLQAVTYGNGTFVVVGENGTILTSQDGMTWTKEVSGITCTLYGVTHGNDMFVAVGGNSYRSRDCYCPCYEPPCRTCCPTDRCCPAIILTSPDGINWTSKILGPVEFGLTGVTYGNGIFIAFDPLDFIFISRNGVDWSSSPGRFKALTYGGGIFWGIGSDNTVQTSPDGVTWTAETSKIADTLNAVSYGNGTFVAVGEHTILTSTDGETWTQRMSWVAGENNYLKLFEGVTCGNSTFVVVGAYGTIVTSSDGVTWTARTSSVTSESLGAVAYGDDTYVAVGQGSGGTGFGGVIVTSIDGVNWTLRSSGRSSGIGFDLYAVAYGSGIFVAVGYDYHTKQSGILTSPDGITWTTKASPKNGPSGITYGNGTFVAVGYQSILTSPDGVTWTEKSSENSNLSAVTYGNGTFVAVGLCGSSNCAKIFTSQDAVNWTPRLVPTYIDALLGITYGNGTFVAVGGNGTIVTSPDGVIWTVRSSGLVPYSSSLREVAYGNGAFVAVGSYGTILTSRDGMTWTQREATANLSGVAYGNGTFIGVGGDGTILQSDPVCDLPVITTQPQNQTILSGEQALLSVIASDSTPLTYQWYQGVSGDRSKPVGTNSSSYTTPALTQTTSYWVRVSNPHGYANSNKATITIPMPCDRTPDPFTFNDQTGVALNATITSNAITAQGITCPAPISITGCTSSSCQYSINKAFYTSSSGTVNNGDTIIVRQTSSSNFSTTTTDLTLSIGGVSGTFSITTAAVPYRFERGWGFWGAGDGRFNRPLGVALDASGNVYVSDQGNHRIQKFDSNGAFLYKWGFYGSGNGQFVSPVGVAVDASGNVYVSDQGNHRIQKFDSNGAFLSKWGSYGSGDGQLHYPDEIAVDASGSVYVVDTGNHRIQKFDSNGAFLTKWGSYGSGNGEFNSPGGVAVDALENVLVSEWENNRIQRFDSNGAFLNKLGSEGNGPGQFDQPYGLATDVSGSLLVADWGNNRIQQFDPSGNYVTMLGSYGTDSGKFYEPAGIAVDAWGNVYVADSGNNRVQKFAPSAETRPPQLLITSHTDGQHVSTPSITLTGTASDSGRGNNGIQQVTVNGSRANNDTASRGGTANWSKVVSLTAESNPITVIAYDNSSNHNQSSTAITIYYDFFNCSYSISPTSRVFGNDAGAGIVSVAAGSGCSWTASTNPANWDWIGISSGWDGTGSGTVNYFVLANNKTSPRTGTLTIAGQTLTIAQQAGGCGYSISPAGSTFGSNAGTGAVNVTMGSGCSWTASTNPASWDWIGISSGASGTGNGTVNYFVLANNTGSARTGTLTIAGQTFTIIQDGGDPLDNWHWRNPLPQGNSLMAVAYGNGIFVVVGQHGTILTSPDGITWTLRPSGVTSDLLGVTYGNGIFVAVGASATILASSDGASWTKENSGTDRWVSGVAYGNGKFVAVGGFHPFCGADPPCGAFILTSTDAVNWENTYLGPSIGGLLGVIYANGIFVGFDPMGGTVGSPDGMNWTRFSASLTSGYGSFWSLAYGNGIFVGFGEFGEVLTSPDGMTWTKGATVIEPAPLGIAYANGTFVAVARNGMILTSLDGVTWTERISGITSDLYGVAYGNGTFVIVGEDGAILQSDPLIAETVSSPTTPSGPASGNIGVDYTYSTGGAISNLGHPVQYRFDWGDETYSEWSSSTTASKLWSSAGTYLVNSQARSATDTSILSSWSGTLSVSISVPETVSTPSVPIGSISGTIDKSYIYSTDGSTSNVGHAIEYQFDWKGDGSDLSNWGSASQSKTWTTAGVYNVRARARCSQDLSVVSDWSSVLTIKISLPEISVTPAAYDYGNIKVKRGKKASFSVKNDGTVNLTISSSIVGADATMFRIRSGGASRTIKPGKTLTINVAFRPTSAGSKEATLRITSNDPVTPTIEIPLIGTGM